MFTGIIETVAKVKKADKKHGSLILTIEKPKGWKIKAGQSISANGACLTAGKVGRDDYAVELMDETLKKTTFGKKVPNKVNLERSVQVDSFLDGHIVLGHTDAVGRIEKIKGAGKSKVYTISFPQKFAGLVAKKGSIAVDGVSLTIVDVKKSGFTVSLVEYTIKHTTLGGKKAGDEVNLEFDIIAKYVGKLITNN